jgi:hypothetical protein
VTARYGPQFAKNESDPEGGHQHAGNMFCASCQSAPHTAMPPAWQSGAASCPQAVPLCDSDELHEIAPQQPVTMTTIRTTRSITFSLSNLSAPQTKNPSRLPAFL